MHLNQSLLDHILSPLDESTRSRVVVSLAEVFCDPDAQFTPKEIQLYDDVVWSQSKRESSQSYSTSQTRDQCFQAPSARP